MTDKQLTLYAWEGNSAAVVYAVQGENQSRKLQLTLVEKRGGEGNLYGAEVIDKPLDLTGMSTPRLYVEKPDGTKVFTDGEITDSQNGIVAFALTAQQLAVSGVASCQVVLTKSGGEVLKVLGMQLDIQRSDLDDAIESKDDFASVLVILGRATAAVEKAETAAANADTKAQTAQTAANNANAVAATVQAKLDNGDFKGEKGEKGTPGGTEELAEFTYKPSALCKINTQNNRYVVQGSLMHIESSLTITPNNGAISVMITGLPYNCKTMLVGAVGKCTADTAVRVYSLMANTDIVVIASMDGTPLVANEKSFSVDFVANYEITPINTLGVQVDFRTGETTPLAGSVGKKPGADYDGYEMFRRQKCTVADDGTITSYEGDPEYTEDGSMGQVMLKQSKVYFKCVPVITEKIENGIGEKMLVANYYISDTKSPGFELFPQFKGREYFLQAAYEGSLWDASANAYIMDDAQVMDTYTDKLCSIAGAKPASGITQSLTRANLEKIAQNRGSGWHLENIETLSLNRILMLVEYAGTNIRDMVGQGVISITDDTGYNCASITGSTASLESATGQATATVNEINGVKTTYTEPGKVAIRYRGMENPWGNIQKMIGGINVWGDGTPGGGQPYICTDTNYQDNKHDGNYISAGFTLSGTSGWLSAVGYSAVFPWLLLPAETQTAEKASVGDYAYATNNLNGYRGVISGGRWSNGNVAGPCSVIVSNLPTDRSRANGGRMIYYPPTV